MEKGRESSQIGTVMCAFGPHPIPHLSLRKRPDLLRLLDDRDFMPPGVTWVRLDRLPGVLDAGSGLAGCHGRGANPHATGRRGRAGRTRSVPGIMSRSHIAFLEWKNYCCCGSNPTGHPATHCPHLPRHSAWPGEALSHPFATMIWKSHRQVHGSTMGSEV